MVRGNLFFGSLLVVTALPFFGLALGAAPYLPGLPVMIAVTGYWHVASTGFSYLDPDYREIVAREPWRFTIPLVALPAAMIGLYFLSPATAVLSSAGYVFWQAYHYQRQNFGLCALAAKIKLPETLGRGLNLAALAGAIALLRFPVYAGFHAFAPIAGWLLAIAAAIYLVAFALVAIAIAGEPRLRQARPFAFVAMSTGFFLPSLLCHDLMAAFWSYAAAHGAQYLVCQGVVAVRAKLSAPRFAAGFAIMAIGGTLGYLTVGNPLATQAYLGLIMVHFLADAKLWRLREAPQRAIIQRRFDFLFAPAHIARNMTIGASIVAPAPASSSRFPDASSSSRFPEPSSS